MLRWVFKDVVNATFHTRIRRPESDDVIIELKPHRQHKTSRAPSSREHCMLMLHLPLRWGSVLSSTIGRWTGVQYLLTGRGGLLCSGI